jgi:hypothetical protein
MAAAIHFHDGQWRRGHSRWGIFALSQGPLQVGGHQGGAFGQPLLANLLGLPLDALGIDAHLGQDA